MREIVPVGTDRLSAEDSGGDGPPLVLLHPGVGDQRVWDGVWRPLAEHFRVVRYDFRGYGASSPPTEPYSWLDDLRAVLTHFGIGSAHLVGTSQGGATALALALEHPQAVRSLVLLAPAVGGWTPGGPPEIAARFAAALASGDEDNLVALMLELWAAAGHEPVVEDLVRSGVRALRGETRFLRPLAPARHRLGEVVAPTLLLVGDRDFAPIVELDDEIAARLPDCRLERLAGVDHFPSLRVPALVVERIRGHCGQIAG
jgi:3-oxoadipate enol-lactonase